MQESKSCALPLGDIPLSNRSIVTQKYGFVNCLGADFWEKFLWGSAWDKKRKKGKKNRGFSLQFVLVCAIMHLYCLGKGREKWPAER